MSYQVLARKWRPQTFSQVIGQQHVLPHGAEEALGWRFHPTQSVEAQEDGSVLVRFMAGGMRELAWHLFTWGDKVQILGPERLRTMMREELAVALRAHADGVD